MIVIFKKRSFIFAFLFILIVISAVCVTKKENTKLVSAIPGFGKTVILDAGHGAPDGGAAAEDGTLEKDLNLKITQYLQGFLEQSGTAVLMTRADDNGIFDEGIKNIKQKKRSDIKNREKLMNGESADIFVSIHINKFSEKKYSGPQVFYSANNEKSKVLAELIQSRMNELLLPQKKRETKKAENNIYLLKKAKLPAVLIECGFISNPSELEKLKSEEYQKSVAWAIYGGICDYFSE